MLRTVAKAGRLEVAYEATEIFTARGRSRGELGLPRGTTRTEAESLLFLAAVDDRHGRQASRQAGRRRRAWRGLRKEGEDCGEEKKKEKWERAGICMKGVREGSDPVLFSLSHKTDVKFFISSLFPSVSFPLPLPSLPLSVPFAAAPLSYLFTCLNSLLPGHIDAKVLPVFHFWQKGRKRHRM